MKRILFGILLSAIFGAAQAGTLEIQNSSAITFSGYDGQPATITGTESSGFWGSLFATSAGTFSATYLGNESGYTDSYSMGVAGSLLEANALGTTISTSVGPGTVSFSFSDDADGGHTFSNGEQQQQTLGFAILSGQQNQYGIFDYILGFNDSYTGDADYDDFVVGVNFTPVAPVPEPQTWTMLVAGLGLLGFTVHRSSRKNRTA